ncbi:MAG: flagellar basal body rod protein FlgB, partial [Lutispora sp.]
MINMISKKINFMERALDAYWVKNEVISNNIANVNTPGYKKYKVNFEEVLSEKREQFSIAANYKNPKFLPIGRDKARIGEVMVIRDFATSMRKDGNNIDI